LLSKSKFLGVAVATAISFAMLLAMTVQPWTGGTASAATSCQFLSSPGAQPAFCEDLSGGASPGGRAGDLDDARWSVTRIVNENNTSSNLYRFPLTTLEPCKGNLTSALPDRDIVVCDAASGHSGQFETSFAAQNYGLLSMRPRQAFDFTGRTGTITYNTDPVTGGGGSWFNSLFITQEPNPGATNQEQVVGVIPRNGVGFNIDDQCSSPTGTAARIDHVYTYAGYVETPVAINSSVCIQTQRGSLNHIEVRINQTNIEIWGSDFSTDGGNTFPNFRLIGQAAISLPFSVGYVHFQSQERAPVKYSFSPTYAANYWSGLGFDGPVVSPEVAYEVPDALTSNTSGGVNLGYGLETNPNSTYTCCPNVTISPFTLSNVNASGVSSAKLTFSIFYTLVNPATGISVHYRLNGGPWQTPNPSPDYSKAFFCGSCPFPPGDAGWSIAYSFPVAVTDLVQGTNTVEVAADGECNCYPPSMGNIELLTFGAGAATPTPTAVPPTNTPTSLPTATSTPTAVATSTPTPAATSTPAAPACQAWVSINGGPGQWQQEPNSFCGLP
jgi:hypothetical protein